MPGVKKKKKKTASTYLLLVSGMSVGVVLEGHLLVRRLDDVLVCVLGDAENLVVVLGHHGFCGVSAKSSMTTLSELRTRKRPTQGREKHSLLLKERVAMQTANCSA